MIRWFRRRFAGATPAPMDCEEVAALLQHYLDGHVDAERADRIAAHLEDCRRCGLEAEAYERIKVTLAAHRPDVPADSMERLREFGERLARGEVDSS
jgi:predicted anti-sigma-YlaC factor YlaD